MCHRHQHKHIVLVYYYDLDGDQITFYGKLFTTLKMANSINGSFSCFCFINENFFIWPKGYRKQCFAWFAHYPKMRGKKTCFLGFVTEVMLIPLLLLLLYIVLPCKAAAIYLYKSLYPNYLQITVH